MYIIWYQKILLIKNKLKTLRMSSLLIYRMQSLLADPILELNWEIQKSFVYVKGIKHILNAII